LDIFLLFCNLKVIPLEEFQSLFSKAQAPLKEDLEKLGDSSFLDKNNEN